MSDVRGKSDPSTNVPTKPSIEDVSEWALAYAAEDPFPLDAAPPGVTRVQLLTDPWSVWCWGWEPVRRTLERRFPSVEVRVLVGGMFETMPNHADLGFDVSSFFGTVHRQTGMPIGLGGLLEERPTSTYPAAKFVHAVRLMRPALEETFLRRLREAVYLDGLNASNEEVAIRICREMGIEPDELREALASGEPDREFHDRMDVLEQLGLHGYPSYIVTVGDRPSMVQGFQSLPQILAIVGSLTDVVHAPLPGLEAEDALVPGERVATREVAELMGVSVEGAYDELRLLEAEGVATRERHPGGDVWIPP